MDTHRMQKLELCLAWLPPPGLCAARKGIFSRMYCPLFPLFVVVRKSHREERQGETEAVWTRWRPFPHLLSRDLNLAGIMATSNAQELFALPNTPLDDDGQPTLTHTEEAEVEEDIYEVLAPFTAVSVDATPPIRLRRRAHVAFLSKLIFKPLPAEWVAFDATRPWLLYWSLHAFTLLNHPIDDVHKLRATSTLLSCQNKALGGFGGSPGQIPHLMATYAAINALAIVGGPGPLPTVSECQSIQDGQISWQNLDKGGWDEIDRKKLYDWMMRLKQPDGSFTVHEGGEVDVRASYCVWCIASLTGIMTTELIQGMSGFLASCQSYEGGLSSTSFPSYTPNLELDTAVPRPALGEAHGGYAFCATAAYLGNVLVSDEFFQDHDGPSVHPSPLGEKALNLRRLTRWTLGLQCPFPSQGGGFKGRINKLVDGCYSWFSGSGMWGVLESLLEVEDSQLEKQKPSITRIRPDKQELWDRQALQLYILLVAQRLVEDDSGHGGEDDVSLGGLRDKPGKRPDAYHTCYNLAGLSGAQHVVRPCTETRRFCYDGWQESEYHAQLKAEDVELRRRVYASTLGFNLAPGRDKIVVGDKRSSNELAPTHPILNVGFLQVRAMLLWAYEQTA